MKLLEQKFITDIPNLFYDKKELEEHDEFMTNYVFPLDNRKNNQFLFEIFFVKYEELSDKVRKNFEEIYIEFRTLFFKNKINSIVKGNSYKLDSNNLKNHINELYKIMGEEEIDKFLNSITDIKN